MTRGPLDDDEMNKSLVQMILQGWGVETSLAGSGVEAIEHLLNQARKYKVGLIFQTTHSVELCRDVVAEVMRVAHEIKIINTICADIRKRQEDAVKLAQEVDLMIVVGSHHSSNTLKLKKLCHKYNKNTIQIENSKDLKPAELKGVKSVGIIGGASTPDILIEEVKKKLRKIGRK